MTRERQQFLLAEGRNIPLDELSDREQIVANWGAAGIAVLNAADGINMKMPASDFVAEYCTPQDGNWNGTLLSGIKRVSRSLFDAIPERMGKKSFFIICAVMRVIGVDTAN